MCCLFHHCLKSKLFKRRDYSAAGCLCGRQEAFCRYSAPRVQITQAPLISLAVLIGAGFASLQFTQPWQTSREQFLAQRKASQEQFLAQQKASQDQFSRQQRSAQDRLISNQVSKGFGQLTVDKMATRLGGIYALEGVMNNSEQYHRPVLEALCTFVGIGIAVRVPCLVARHTVSGLIANHNVYLLCYTIF